jgi:hypothetical protein
MERINNLTEDREGIIIESQLSKSPQLSSLPPPPLSTTAQPTESVIYTDEYVKKNADVVKQVKLQELLKVPKSDEDEKDILMVTMPVGAVVSKSIWEFSRVTFMVIVIITLLIILLVLYVTDVPVILIPSY